MGFNYWSLIATDVALAQYSVESAISLGRQVIHIHDYDQEKSELTSLHLNQFLSTDPSILPYADSTYFAHKNIKLDSVDIFDDEQPTFIADLGIPPTRNIHIQSRRNSYDAVFDLGTSEHVGSPFTSIQNAFYLLKPGGYYFYDLPYTGWHSHGLFQFNPSFFSELARVNLLDLKFQFLHPTCRDGIILAVRDNINVSLNVITSIFGCIQKPQHISDSLTIIPPVQSFSTHSTPEAINISDITQNLNVPIFNTIQPTQFVDYMYSRITLPLFWSYFDKSMHIGESNIYNPFSETSRFPVTF